MSTPATSAHADSLVTSWIALPYHSFRNISCPEDNQNGRRVYAGHVPASSILVLDTKKNVREYLVDAEGKKRKAMTQVHRAILDTLREHPEDFSILNGGVVIVAKDCQVDEGKKTIKLLQPSIINGAQTQGILDDFYTELKVSGQPSPEIHISYELIVCDDEGLIGEISVARNYQNNVALISIAGRKGQLEELERSVQAKHPEKRLRMKETDLLDDFIDTERLIQVITALVPDELWIKSMDNGVPTKAFTYSQKAQCLKDFQSLYVKVRTELTASNKEKALYDFFLSIASEALDLYKKWKVHQGFIGTRIMSISRSDRRIVDVPDGIVFPILASLSVFAYKSETGTWTLRIPDALTDKELIDEAATVYKEIAESNPSTMGKRQACYSSLRRITTIYKKFTSGGD